jgi:hypothetical protein
MAEQHAGKPAPKAGRGMLRIAYGLFFLFFVNLIGGKCNIAFHWRLPHWDGVAEFMLFGAATIMLIGAALKREAAESDSQNLKPKGGGK